MDYIEFKAKTVDEAITQACLKYGVTSSRLDYIVLEEGKAGFFFGIGSREAVIKARPKAEEEKIEIKAEKMVKPAKSEKPVRKKAERKTENRAESKADNKNEKKADARSEKKSGKSDGKNSQNSAKMNQAAANKPAEKTAEKSVEKETEKSTDKVGKQERKSDRTGGKPEKKYNKETRSAETDGKKADQKEGQAKQAGAIVTADEIEKRAAAAAARAKEEGTVYPEEKEERPRKRDRRDRRGRNDRRDRKGGKYGDNSRMNGGVKEAAEKPNKQSQPKPERVVVPKTEEEIAEMKEKAGTFLESIFKCMNIDVKMNMEYDQTEGCLECTFSGDEMGILIGKRGQTLDSLQYLTSLVINKNKNDYTRVKLDTEDYRARRADTLENLANSIATKVSRTRRPIALEAMNPYERRIIHSSLQGNRFVETYSEGEEPYRHVVVTPKRK